jgi:NDP-sugar pyrophosphorylase family protein
VLDPQLLERLPEGVSDSVRDLYLPLLGEGAYLAGVRYAGTWYDFGRPALYRDAQLRMLRSHGRRQLLVGSGARIAPTALVSRSVLGGRSQVAAGARVEHSVLWERARVERGARVARAIVTADARVRAGERAEDVIVMPAGALDAAAVTGFERHDDMAWVAIT